MFLHRGVQSCGSFHINFELYYIKIVSVARDEAANYRSTYGSPIPLKVSFQSIYFRIKDSKSLNQMQSNWDNFTLDCASVCKGQINLVSQMFRICH